MNVPPDVPAEAAAFLQQMGYLEPDRCRVGDRVPVFTLLRLDGSGAVRIGATEASLPTVLIFGSYT